MISTLSRQTTLQIRRSSGKNRASFEARVKEDFRRILTGEDLTLKLAARDAIHDLEVRLIFDFARCERFGVNVVLHERVGVLADDYFTAEGVFLEQLRKLERVADCREFLTARAAHIAQHRKPGMHPDAVQQTLVRWQLFM